MGQAKKRGTFEQRKAAAIAIKEVAKRESAIVFHPRNLIRPRTHGIPSTRAAVALAIATGIAR